MRKKYVFNGILVMTVITVIYFENIIYAFICHSENINRQTINVMLQGRLNPIKEITLTINNLQYNIPLPENSGEINKDEFLVPKNSWEKYKNSITKTEWTYFDQIGTLVRVKNKLDYEFNISIKPYTGAYVILKYLPVNK